jgi:integrase/recombinase XerD
MRSGELFSLRWRDADCKNGSIRVWPYEGYSPKGKRPGDIPIPNMLKRILLKLSKNRELDDLAFRPYTHNHTLCKQFAKISKKMGMKGTLHDLRHTFDSHLPMAGVLIQVISELVGHSNITTTTIYAHLSPTAHKDAIEKLQY